MKLLFWTPFFLPATGGIETLTAYLLPELAKRGHQIELVTSHGESWQPDEDCYRGIPVHRFHFRRAVRKEDMASMLAIMRRVSELKARFQPDLVHLHVSDPSGFFHLKTRKAHPAQTLVTVHNVKHRFGERQTDSMLVELLQVAGGFTSVSKAILADWVSAYPFLASKSHLVYNGIELPNLELKPLPANPTRLVCLGRMVPHKRFDLAIQIMVQLKKRFPGIQLTIVGDGDLRMQLEGMVSDLGLAGCVHFTGNLAHPDIPAMLNDHTMLLIPSDWEGLPMVALEAAGMARPVVATAVGGNPEIVRHGQNGLVVPPGDLLSLLDAVSKLIEQPDLAIEMGKKGRQLVQTHFSLSTTADGYEKIYNQLVQGYAQ